MLVDDLNTTSSVIVETDYLVVERSSKVPVLTPNSFVKVIVPLSMSLMKAIINF